jgi:hypothetical protein
MTAGVEALRRPLLEGAAALLASAGAAVAQKLAATDVRSFDAYGANGTPTVASMNRENIGELVRMPVKGDSTSGARQ